METNVVRILPEMKLREVIELMIKHQISGAPVVDSLDRVISMIGEGDAIRLAATAGIESTIAHCLQHLVPSHKLITLTRTAPFSEAYQIFLKHKIHRIPVVDGGGALKGFVTRSLILRIFVEAYYGKKVKQQSA